MATIAPHRVADRYYSDCGAECGRLGRLVGLFLFTTAALVLTIKSPDKGVYMIATLQVLFGASAILSCIRVFILYHKAENPPAPAPVQLETVTVALHPAPPL